MINALYLLRHQCPDAKIAVAGYSQGAQVVRETYAELSRTNAADDALLHHTYAIALFGDPHHRPGDPVNVEPETAHEHGALWPAYSQLPDNLLGRLRSWCLPGDPICTGFSKIKLAMCVPLSRCPHMRYAETATQDAADWMAAMLHLTPTAALPSTSPPSPPQVTPSVKATPSAPPTSPASAPPSSAAVTPAPGPHPPALQENPTDVPPPTDPGQQPLPATASELGSPDFGMYCQHLGSLYAQQRYPNTWGWRCSPSPVPAPRLRVGDEDISVDDACSLQYGEGAKSHYRSFDDPASWFCWR